MVKYEIQTFARVRPTKQARAIYSVDNDEQTARLEFLVPRDIADGVINNKRENYSFRFQRVFDHTASQEDIFETIAKPVADNVLAGYNGTIFAYGQTGSGKTFTITGGAERYSDRGIIPRTLSYLYQQFSKDSSQTYTAHISYLEIYNEAGYDLLNPHHTALHLEDLPRVTIMEDSEQNIHLKNLSLQQPMNEEAALDLLFFGDTNRMIAETPMNQASTRSHCIFTVHLRSKAPGSDVVRRSKLHLVDLAGSERVKKMGLGGQILTEAKYINLSLHYLEQVIIALSEKNRSHVPYRNSLMTSVLRDSLGGNCLTSMISTVSVDKRNIEESISTCRFAQRVALIRNEALVNEELDPALLISRLKSEIQLLKNELSLVTGEQRSDELTEEEMQMLQEKIMAYLQNPDPEVILDPGPDMRKIQYCFSFLKGKVQARAEEEICENDEDVTSPPDTSEELQSLRNLITQRDNEISVLLNMLEKEKKAAEPVAPSHKPSEDHSDAITQAEESSEDDTPEGSARDQLLPTRSLGTPAAQQEALQLFVKNHADYVTIKNQKALIRQRFSEGLKLVEDIKEIKGRVNKLKGQLKTRRMQLAAQGLTEAQTPSESDAVEEEIISQIQAEKERYSKASEDITSLRQEIEHLQMLREKHKVKVQMDLEDWWSRQNKSADVIAAPHLHHAETC